MGSWRGVTGDWLIETWFIDFACSTASAVTLARASADIVAYRCSKNCVRSHRMAHLYRKLRRRPNKKKKRHCTCKVGLCMCASDSACAVGLPFSRTSISQSINLLFYGSSKAGLRSQTKSTIHSVNCLKNKNMRTQTRLIGATVILWLKCRPIHWRHIYLLSVSVHWHRQGGPSPPPQWPGKKKNFFR